MSTIIRRCLASDWRSMARLRMACHTHAGHAVSTFTSASIAVVDARYQQTPHLAVGLWQDDVLQCYICAYAHQDFWTLDLMIASGDPKQLQAVLQAVLVHFESIGVTQFWYAFPAKWARAYRSFWKRGAPALRKYTIEDIDTIQPYRVPTDAWIWEHILHRVVVPVPFLLRRSYVA